MEKRRWFRRVYVELNEGADFKFETLIKLIAHFLVTMDPLGLRVSFVFSEKIASPLHDRKSALLLDI